MDSPRTCSAPGSPSGTARRRLPAAPRRSRARHAGRARMDVVGSVGQEDVQRLGRADAVEDVDAEPVGEPSLQRSRQRLARGGAQPHRVERLDRDVAGGERGVEGRYPEEQRRPGPLQSLSYDVRGRPPRLEHRRRPDGEREEHRVADAVGEEHLGDRERDVVGGDAEHLGGVRLADVADVGVPVHRGLGQPGRAGRVEPQRPGVVDCRRDLGQVRLLTSGDQLVPGVHEHVLGHVQASFARVAGEHPVLDVRAGGEASLTAFTNSGVASTARAPESTMTFASSGPVNIVETGTATSPARNAPRMPVEHRDLVGHHEHHPVVATQPEAAQSASDDADPLVQVGVGQRLARRRPRSGHRGPRRRAGRRGSRPR